MHQNSGSSAAIFNDTRRHEIRTKVKEVLRGNNPRIASAFLGVGAEKEVPKQARLICDIGMGATSPTALEQLSQKLGTNLKWLPRFHPKVYLSDFGCVVGSANLSNNGIGFLSDRSLNEAAIFLSHSHDAATALYSWFEEIWDQAKVVDEHAIEIARNAWKRAKINAPELPRAAHSISDAFSSLASDEGGWRIVVTYEALSNEALEAYESEKEEVASRYGLQSLGHIHVYEWGCPWPKKQHHIIRMHMGSRGGIQCCALRYLSESELENEYYLSFFEELNWEAYSLPRLPKAFKTKDGHLSKLIKSQKTTGKWDGKIMKGRKFAKALQKFLDSQ